MQKPFGLTEDYSDEDAEDTEYYIPNPKLTDASRRAMEEAVARIRSEYRKTPVETDKKEIDKDKNSTNGTEKEKTEYWWTTPMPGVHRLNQRKTRNK